MIENYVSTQQYYEGEVIEKDEKYYVKFSVGILPDTKKEFTIPLIKEDYQAVKNKKIIPFRMKMVYVEPDDSIHCNRGSDVAYAKYHEFTYQDFRIDEKVRTDYYENEVFVITGIRKNELELEGDWSAMYNVIDKSWYPIGKIKKIFD